MDSVYVHCARLTSWQFWTNQVRNQQLPQELSQASTCQRVLGSDISRKSMLFFGDLCLFMLAVPPGRYLLALCDKSGDRVNR